jgi:hypothetical protein
MVLQAEICGNKAGVMENVGKDNTSRYIYILSVRQPSRPLTISKYIPNQYETAIKHW